jgi:hypothetical protein
MGAVANLVGGRDGGDGDRGIRLLRPAWIRSTSSFGSALIAASSNRTGFDSFLENNPV